MMNIKIELTEEQTEILLSAMRTAYKSDQFQNVDDQSRLEKIAGIIEIAKHVAKDGEFLMATSENSREFEIHHFITEASMLQIPPGKTPYIIKTTLGNGEVFRLSKVGEAGELIYHQSMGCVKLTVLND